MFGEIRARNLLAPKEASRTGGEHNRLGRPDHTLAELHDDKTGDSLDVFSSPWAVAVRWDDCSKKCSVSCAGSARAANRDGYADAPEALQPARRASAVVSNRIAPAVDGVVDEAGGTKYPEWDVYRRRYRPDWCTVHEVDPPPTGSALADMWGGYDVRRPLARLGLGLGRYHRQAQGDDIDIDAAVEKRVELMAGSAPDEAVYLDSLRRRRDLAVLLLLDVSGSAAEPGAIGQTVHTQQRPLRPRWLAPYTISEIGWRSTLFTRRAAQPWS
ncbi:hypothetical protein I552_4413 [Mycobacterium xenopi 3993]|nr:hypothetical protein I552_4413 [Mycobacterium xenopi 3993]